MEINDIQYNLVDGTFKNNEWYYFKMDNINEYLFMSTHLIEGISIYYRF